MIVVDREREPIFIKQEVVGAGAGGGDDGAHEQRRVGCDAAVVADNGVATAFVKAKIAWTLVSCAVAELKGAATVAG